MEHTYITSITLSFKVEADSEEVAKKATEELIPEMLSTHVNCASSDPKKSYYLTTVAGYLKRIVKTR
jgi:hypothetical protein